MTSLIAVRWTEADCASSGRGGPVEWNLDRTSLGFPQVLGATPWAGVRSMLRAVWMAGEQRTRIVQMWDPPMESRGPLAANAKVELIRRCE